MSQNVLYHLNSTKSKLYCHSSPITESLSHDKKSLYVNDRCTSWGCSLWCEFYIQCRAVVMNSMFSFRLGIDSLWALWESGLLCFVIEPPLNEKLSYIHWAGSCIYVCFCMQFLDVWTTNGMVYVDLTGLQYRIMIIWWGTTLYHCVYVSLIKLCAEVFYWQHIDNNILAGSLWASVRILYYRYKQLSDRHNSN